MESEEMSEENGVLCNLRSIFNTQSDGSSLIMLCLAICLVSILITILLTEKIIKIKRLSPKTKDNILEVFSKLFIVGFLFFCVLFFLKCVELMSPEKGIKLPQVAQLIIYLLILSFLNILLIVIMKRIAKKKPVDPQKARIKLYFIPLFYFIILCFLLFNQCNNFHINFFKSFLYKKVPPYVPKLFDSEKIQYYIRVFLKGLFYYIGTFFQKIRLPQAIFKEYSGCLLIEILIATLFIILINYYAKNSTFIGWVFNTSPTNVEKKNGECLINKSMIYNFINDIWFWSLLVKIIMIIVIYQFVSGGGGG